MPLLKCNVKSCYYNEDNKCCLDTIQVEGRNAETEEGTACGSFRLRKESTTNSSGHDMPKNAVSVTCEARNCKYNEDCDCTAKDIGIGGGNACTCGETKCASFEQR